MENHLLIFSTRKYSTYGGETIPFSKKEALPYGRRFFPIPLLTLLLLLIVAVKQRREHLHISYHNGLANGANGTFFKGKVLSHPTRTIGC
jgi:hypothetical protein